MTIWKVNVVKMPGYRAHLAPQPFARRERAESYAEGLATQYANQVGGRVEQSPLVYKVVTNDGVVATFSVTAIGANPDEVAALKLSEPDEVDAHDEWLRRTV